MEVVVEKAEKMVVVVEVKVVVGVKNCCCYRHIQYFLLAC